jgi:hypothetical protein
MELLFVVWMSEARGRAEVTAGVTSKELDVTADGVWVGWGGGLQWNGWNFGCALQAELDMSTPRQNQSKHLSERFHDSTGKINVRFRFTSQELINLMVFKKQFLRSNLMEQSPAPEADSYSDTLKIHGILWNLKVN